VDFEKNIVAFTTNYQGYLLDSTCARKNNLFKGICMENQQNFALGDPGFQNVDYIIAGLKSNMIASEKHRILYRVTKSEQVCVEHVNQFLKNFKSLGMKHRHDNATLVGCVYVACGLYIWKKKNGYY
jgi:hypothetical protein